jgi:hypothetical protein
MAIFSLAFFYSRNRWSKICRINISYHHGINKVILILKTSIFPSFPLDLCIKCLLSVLNSFLFVVWPSMKAISYHFSKVLFMVCGLKWSVELGRGQSTRARSSLVKGRCCSQYLQSPMKDVRACTFISHTFIFKVVFFTALAMGSPWDMRWPLPKWCRVLSPKSTWRHKMMCVRTSPLLLLHRCWPPPFCMMRVDCR